MASDDESVLTEYDQLDGEEEEGSESQIKRRSSSKSGYKLKNALKPPRATTYTAQALYEQIHSGDIELNPEYQRDVVWKDEKQVNLIDSILRNFYIPPVIFAYRAEDDGTELRTCIDGKQRLTSIHRFMDGFIPHKDQHTGELLWFKDNGDNRGRTKKNILPEKLRTSFSNKQIVCVEYSDLRDCDERDIFKRVQLGVALTAAEKMNVISTPRADFVRLLMERYLTAELLGNPEIPWSMTRGTDFKCIASSVFCISRSGQTTWSGVVQVENWLAETKGHSIRAANKLGRRRGLDVNDEDDYNDLAGVPLPENFRKQVIETFEVMVQLANNNKYNQAFRPSLAADNISPIEMTGIPLLVYNVYVSPPPSSPARGDDRISLQRLSDLILLMRAYLHKNHTDVRQNARVGKDMLQFCLDVSKDPNQFFHKHSELLGWKAPPKMKRVPNRATVVSNKRKKVAGKDDDNHDHDGDGNEYQATKRSRTFAMQGARKSTGGRAPPVIQSTGGPSSAPASRKSPPNPQMLPSPDPTSTPSHPTVKSEPETQMPPTSQMFPPFQLTDAQKEWYQQQQARIQMMAGSSIGMEPMMAFLSSQQMFPYMSQSLAHQSSVQEGGGGIGDGGRQGSV